MAPSMQPVPYATTPHPTSHPHLLCHSPPPYATAPPPMLQPHAYATFPCLIDVTSPPPMPQPHTATAPLPTLQPPAGTFLSTSVRPCTVSGECSSSSTASCLSVMAARSDRGRRNHSLNSLRPWAGEGGEGGRTVRGREAGASGEGQAYHVRHAALHVPKWTPPPHHVHDPRQNPPPLRPTMLVTQRCMTPNSEKPSLTLPMPMLDGCCSTWKICSARALNGSTCRKLVEGGGGGAQVACAVLGCSTVNHLTNKPLTTDDYSVDDCTTVLG